MCDDAELLLKSDAPIKGNDWLRFRLLREKVLEEVERQRKRGEPGKMCDGDMSVKMIVENDGSVTWEIWMYCYLLGPHRQYEWQGTTLSEALDKAVADVSKWILEAKEMDK